MEEAQDIKSFLDDLGMAIMEVRGGSAGPLYGTLIGGLGVDLNDGENTLCGRSKTDVYWLPF